MTNKLTSDNNTVMFGPPFIFCRHSTQNLLKLLVMASMVICHQKIKGHMNTELK